MKLSLLSCLFVISGYIANAQFTILPQLGFENSRTSIQFKDLSSFSPAGAKLTPQAGLRLDYKNKQGHGAFVGVATTRSIVKFNFADPQNAMNVYSTSKANTNLRLEAGYQVSTKPIYFKKSASANKSSKISYEKNMGRKSCGSYMSRSSCGSKANKGTAARPADKEKGSWVRIQPSAGVAYLPFTPEAGIYTKSGATQTMYEYNAGNWKTALISSVGFEFGRNANSKFMLSVNYLKGISNLDTKSITTVAGNKSTTTSLKSDASSWSLRMGIPVNLSKKKSIAVKPQAIEKPSYNYNREEKKCGQYRSQYKSHCGKVI